MILNDNGQVSLPEPWLVSGVSNVSRFSALCRPTFYNKASDFPSAMVISLRAELQVKQPVGALSETLAGTQGLTTGEQIEEKDLPEIWHHRASHICSEACPFRATSRSSRLPRLSRTRDSPCLGSSNMWSPPPPTTPPS